MSVLAGILASKVGPNLPFRIFNTLQFKRNVAVLCLKGREYSSFEGPVRFIAKVVENGDFNRRLDDVERSFRSGENAWNGKRRELMNGETKNDGGIMKNDSAEETEEDVEDTITESQKDGGKQKTLQDAEKIAVALLAKRAITAAEMRKKLLQKRFSPKIVEALVSDYQSRGFINDGLYAELFCQSRWSSLTWGPKRIKQALFKKGVSEADAENALKFVFENKESKDQKSKFMDHLLVQASKQWQRSQNLPKETRKARIVRWLQYRGFGWNVIGSILKKLES